MKTSVFLNKTKRMQKQKNKSLQKAKQPIRTHTDLMVDKTPTISMIEEDLAIIRNVLASHNDIQAGDDVAIGSLGGTHGSGGSGLDTPLTHQPSVNISLPSESLIQEDINLTPGDLSGQTIPVVVTHQGQVNNLAGMEGVVVVVSRV